MQVNNLHRTSFNNTTKQNTPKVSFKGFKAAKFLDALEVGHSGELSRNTFVTIASLFMLGGRFFESRGVDEKREVLTRDVPAIFGAVFTAPLINNGLGYLITKLSGVPIITSESKKINFKTIISDDLKLTKNKHIQEWYGNIHQQDGPVTAKFIEGIKERLGNVKKVFAKLDLHDKLETLLGSSDADKISIKEISARIQQVQQSTGSTKAKQALDSIEKTLKREGKNSLIQKLCKTARFNQAITRLTGVLFSAALLGFALPRLNIINTRKKYLNKEANTVQNNKPTNFKTTINEAQKNIFNKFITS